MKTEYANLNFNQVENIKQNDRDVNVEPTMDRNKVGQFVY